MAVNILSALLYLVYLVAPGYIFLRIIRVRRYRFLLSYTISFSLLVSTHLISAVVGLSIFDWSILLHLFIFLLFIFGYLFSTGAIHRLNQIEEGNNRPFIIGLLSVLIVFSIYHLSVGPYTEIPSDFWKHIARTVAFTYQLPNNVTYSIAGESILNRIPSEAESIYFIHATVAYFLAVNPLTIASSATLVMSGIFLGSVYCFSTRLFSYIGFSGSKNAIAGILASLFTLLFFGTATFSFVRYYAYFPTIFCFPLMYLSIAIFLDYLESSKYKFGTILFIPPIILVAALAHRQEAVFSIIFLFGISIVKAIRSFLSPNSYCPILIKRIRVIGLTCTIIFLVFLSATLLFRTSSQWGHSPHVIDVGVFLPLLDGWPIANPTFRFWDTLGWFGIVVYVWYLVDWKTIKNLDFITVGMLSPLFTHLNPFYAELFLHFGSSTALWRTSYLMPLPIVASFLLVNSPTHYSNAKSFIKLIQAGVFTILLIFSFIPFDTRYIRNDNSRLPSLRPIHSQSGAGLWADLISAIREIQADHNVRQILTDSVTRFVLYSSITGDNYWWTSQEYFPQHYRDYRQDLLGSDFTDSLLIINRRNGMPTGSSMTSGHWPPAILNISNKYPPDIDQFLASHPALFNLIWSGDEISVYLINEPLPR